MDVENSELVSARDLSRNYASLIERLVKGELEKVVITKHGKLEAVVVTTARYEAMTGGER